MYHNSLKFLRLKIFADFVGQSASMKILSPHIKFYNRCKAWLEAQPRKFYPWKFVFWAEFGKTTKYLSLEILGYMVLPGLFHNYCGSSVYGRCIHTQWYNLHPTCIWTSHLSADKTQHFTVQWGQLSQVHLHFHVKTEFIFKHIPLVHLGC